MKRSKTNYRGGEALVLSTSALELVVTASVGPRVISLRSKEGDNVNVFHEFPADEVRSNGYYLRGGHRLWHSPEHTPRTYQPDDLPLVVKELPKGVALTQPVEPKTGIQKGMRIELLGERTVKVTHTLTNRGLWPVETAPWALTMLRAGGYGVLPLPPKGDHARGDFLPTYSLVPWSYTDLSLPVWDLHRDFIGIDVPQANQAQKLGITHYPGWSAYWIEGTTFVKFAGLIEGGRYPDLGCSFEAFTNGKLIELETLGTFDVLAPEATATHVEHWSLFDQLERPDSPETFEALAKVVGAWLKKI